MRWLLLVLLTSGCVTTQTLGTARTVDRGTARYMASTEVSALRTKTNTLPTLSLGAGIRYGLTHRTELGVTAWGLPTPVASALGASTDVKIALKRAPEATSGTDIALVPSVGYQWVGMGGARWHLGTAR